MLANIFCRLRAQWGKQNGVSVGLHWARRIRSSLNFLNTWPQMGRKYECTNHRWCGGKDNLSLYRSDIDPSSFWLFTAARETRRWSCSWSQYREHFLYRRLSPFLSNSLPSVHNSPCLSFSTYKMITADTTGFVWRLFFFFFNLNHY